MKKNILLVAILVVIMASFVACKNEEPVASEPASSSEEVSEPASEEMSSEEVSEEASSEEVVEDTSVYSADAIMKLADELAAKYPIENPEHIKATLIMANLDKISDEDRITLFDAYGFTYELLESTFKEYLESVDASEESTSAYYSGNESYAEKANFAERMPIVEVVLSNDDKEFAQVGHKYLCACYKEGIPFEEWDAILASEVENGTFTYADCVSYNYVMNDAGNYLSPYEYFGLETGN